jgi:hypothetical protein
LLTASGLLTQGRSEELWQMCCGFLKLNLNEFMEIQERLLLEQLELLSKSDIGKKVMRGKRPQSVEEFRRTMPLTRYKDYCPELLEKREDGLPGKPVQWIRTSGRSGEYVCRWIPMTAENSHELSIILYGIGMIASSKGWNSPTSHLPIKPNMMYTVAPRPYMTGALAHILEQQTEVNHLPSLEKAEGLSFEDRIKLGFKQALFDGIDYFFGLSMVLVQVGEKFSQSSAKIDIKPFLVRPKALYRLVRGVTKSKLAHRPLLPKDLWNVKGIMSSGLDSVVYRNKIKELWGKYPLDVYATTEGGIIATQTWDNDSMTFIPNLNFLEFIPEEEQLKLEMDRTYVPKTLLLNEVKAGETYEIVLTNFHGGALVRYRIGDLVKITSLINEKSGIVLPQMIFESRADGVMNFVVVQLTEKIIWQAIEKSGVLYEDWVAYKLPGESVLHLLIELKNGERNDPNEIGAVIANQIMRQNEVTDNPSGVLDDLRDMMNFKVDVELLPKHTFANYIATKQKEGADIAHIKPPHMNPTEKTLELLIKRSKKTEATATVE